MQNLIIGGRKTRFQLGNKATNKELVSRLAKTRMLEYWSFKRNMKISEISRLIKLLKP